MFEETPSVVASLGELGGVIVPSKHGRELIEAKYQQAIVYGWYAVN